MPLTNEPARKGPEAVLDFWSNAGFSKWFSKDDAFDAELHTTFLADHEAAAAGALDDWATSPTGALALMILLDQFPRNSFRGTPRMYASDPLARHHAKAALAAGFDEQVPRELAFFFYLPLSHSEDLADQDLSVALHEKIQYTQHALQHRDIIRRFGRFPHRNAILGRTSTPEEVAFLAAGGFAG